MSEWRIKIDPLVEEAILKACTQHPHLSALIEKRLEELLDFPPHRWFKIKPQGPFVIFTPEPGQKLRFWGEAWIQPKTIYLQGFSIHE